MKDAIKSARIVDGLLKPHYILLFTASTIIVSSGVFLGNFLLIDFRGRENEDEGNHRTWNQSQKIWIVYGQDILEIKARGDS
jgi:hypothetical protein